MELRLSHYVYSSLGGYRTLYVSPTMPRDLVRPLEGLAKQIYRTAARRQVLGWLRPSDEVAILVKAFQNGTDHAGRPRTCVHAAAIALADAAGFPFFSLLALPEDVFLPPDAQLQSLESQLRPTINLSDPSGFWPSGSLPRESVAALMSLMLVPGLNALVVDHGGETLATLRALAWMCPSRVRRTLTVMVGAPLVPVDGIGGARIVVMPADAKADSPAQHDVMLNFPDETGRAATMANSYAVYIASNLGGEKGRAVNKSLVGLLERYPPQYELTQVHYTHLVMGFGKVERNVTPDGGFDFKSEPFACLSAVRDFALAGIPELAHYILEAVASKASSQYGLDDSSVRPALGKIRMIKDGERQAEAYSFLADRIDGLIRSVAKEVNAS